MKIPPLAKVFNHNLFGNISIVFSESIVTKALNFIIILILSIKLGPEDYGKYSFIFVLVAFFSAFFDFGMENTAVRFSAKVKDKTHSIFGLYVFVKTSILLVVVLSLSLFGKQIFGLMGKSQITDYIPYLIIGFIGESLLFVNDTYLQASKQFKLRALINISRYMASVIVILLLVLTNKVVLNYVVIIYVVPIIISLLFTFKYVVFIKSYFSIPLSKDLIKEIIHYEKWMLMVSIPNNYLSRIDFMMISLWASYEQIGIYNVAFQLSAIVSFIPFAFSKVMLPTFSELAPQQLVESTKKITKTTLIISLIMLCLIPIVHWVVPLLLGNTYLDSIKILQVMLISAILAFAIVPIETAVYSLGKPTFITMGKYIELGTIVLLIFITVPFLGVVWAALSVAVGRFIYGVILLKLYVNYKNKYVFVEG